MSFQSIPSFSHEFDGFLNAQEPQHYLDAPATLNPGLNTSYDMASQSYFDISPLLNIRDPINLHFLVQTSIADSKGFKILSYQELEEAKKEAILLKSRVSDLTVKLNMEYKLRDAASSLSKLHSSGSAAPSQTQQRKSFLFSSSSAKEKKRLSKHAEDELEVSNKRIHTIQEDLSRLSQRLSEVEARIYKHNVGILALTHHGSESSTSEMFDNYSQAGDVGSRIGSPNSSTVRKSRQSFQASSRMLDRNIVSERSLSPTTTGEFYTRELDGMINSLSEALNMKHSNNDDLMNTPSVITDNVEDKVSQLSTLITSIINEYSQSLQSDDKYKSDLEALVHQVMLKIHMGNEIPDFTNIDKLQEKLLATLEERCRKDAEDVAASDMLAVGGPRGKSLLRKQFESISASYEANRVELEKLELENVDLRTNLRDTKFGSQAEIQELKNELKSNEERVQEWKERCDTTRGELESVVQSLEEVTRQAIEYETERTKLETTVRDLEQKLFQATNSTLDKRVSMIATEHDGLGSGPTSEPSSVSILRQEFRKIIKDINTKHAREMRQEQQEIKKLQNLLRSIKTSSYAAHLPQANLDALGIEAL